MKRLMALTLILAATGILSACCDCDKKALQWGPGPFPWTPSGTVMNSPMNK